jgi:pilus assembly protein Flp/PilA
MSVGGESPIELLSRESHPMKNVLQSVKKFLKSEDGPTAVEYAVMLALIVIVCLTAIRAVGTNASARFNDIANELTTP